MAKGEALGALALTEPNAGIDLLSQQTEGKPVQGGYQVSGNKIFICNAELAYYFLILFRTSPEISADSFTLGVVEKGTPGFSVGKKEETMGLRGHGLGELILDECFIPEENILGSPGEGLMYALTKAGVWNDLGVAATATGAAQGCMDMCKSYAQKRIAFGGPIANQQVIQSYIGEMSLSIDTARLVLHKAAENWNQGVQSPDNYWKPRVFCPEVAEKVSGLTQKIYGAQSYSLEYPVARFIRDIHGLPFVYGTPDLLKLS